MDYPQKYRFHLALSNVGMYHVKEFQNSGVLGPGDADLQD